MHWSLHLNDGQDNVLSVPNDVALAVEEIALWGHVKVLDRVDRRICDVENGKVGVLAVLVCRPVGLRGLDVLIRIGVQHGGKRNVVILQDGTNGGVVRRR